eukprot:m.302596 g.302596  ORF g.302596 m.302596 type:complete len:97 (-) comp23000_c0_seq16:252-542(-)
MLSPSGIVAFLFSCVRLTNQKFFFFFFFFLPKKWKLHTQLKAGVDGSVNANATLVFSAGDQGFVAAVLRADLLTLQFFTLSGDTSPAHSVDIPRLL